MCDFTLLEKWTGFLFCHEKESLKSTCRDVKLRVFLFCCRYAEMQSNNHLYLTKDKDEKLIWLAACKEWNQCKTWWMIWRMFSRSWKLTGFVSNELKHYGTHSSPAHIFLHQPSFVWLNRISLCVKLVTCHVSFQMVFRLWTESALYHIPTQHNVHLNFTMFWKMSVFKC